MKLYEKKVLKKDIIIPAGSIFTTAPRRTDRCDGHYIFDIGLTKDTCGSFIYYIDKGDEEELSDYFEDVPQCPK
jgi:hypothetical protein